MIPRKGPTWPTLAQQLLDARDGLSLYDAVVLAVRADRHRRGLSQRGYAAERGWSKSFVARLETRPGALPFAAVVDALRGTAGQLVLTSTDGPDPDPDADADGDGDGDDLKGATPIPAEAWPASELVARDAAGRRLPAHHFARRITLPHTWWDVRHRFEHRPAKPTWTAERRPPLE